MGGSVWDQSFAPFLNIGFNLAILRSSGKVGGFIDKFNIFSKGRANNSASSLRNVAGIWSSRAALLVSRLVDFTKIQKPR